MFRRIIIIAAFATIPLLGACNLNPMGPVMSDQQVDAMGRWLDQGW